MTDSPGRTAQRARTRQAILDGARQLLDEGQPVTVAAAAARNGVSKATSYRYFPDSDLLVTEAALHIAVAPYDQIVRDCPDLRGKLQAICLYFLDLALSNEAGFRQFIAATMRSWRPDSTAPPRGARRITMFRQALAEHESDLADEQQDRLVRALCAATGMEAMIAMIDVAAASPDQAREAVRFTVDALLDRAARETTR
ncbi:TetR/AcrR family transcriptional regulator [Roseobacter sp. HKCCA0434]|uniref:TetR/AcrR family transcriptional regulator n=1 Tax=Roseobacter sp. HKCCA0434 TaxID=3079297 RepID=UPI002905C276|nr:TetR/AcrR family transcriptional regulator [Roseobacter sp. HKCCA0434]